MGFPIKHALLSHERKTYLDKEENEKKYQLDLSETNLENIDPLYLEWLLKDFHSWFGYPNFHYYDLFVEKICLRFWINLEKNQVFLWHGSFNIIERVLHKFLDLEYLIGYGPQFNEIPSDFEFTWGKYISSNFSSSKMWLSADLIEMTLKKCSTKKAIYIDNPNNPTGYFYTPREIEKIIQLAQKNEAIVIVDEAFGDYLPDEYSAIHFVTKYPNLIVVRSMSKFFGLSGLRIWYSAMSEELSKYYSKVDVPFEPGVLSLHIWMNLINNTDIINTIRTKLSLRKKAVMDFFAEKNITAAATNESTPLVFFIKPNNEIFSSVKLIDGESFDNTFEAVLDYSRLRLPNTEEEMNLLLKQ